MTRISEADFAHLVKVAPLVAVDLIIQDSSGRILLGRRTNEPAKGYLFVPGGVIRKNERVADAFNRVVMAETGVALPFGNARCLGVYDHIYEKNRFGDPSFGTHYVVIGYELSLPDGVDIREDSQHSEFIWKSVPELMASAEVHANTKAYFQAAAR